MLRIKREISLGMGLGEDEKKVLKWFVMMFVQFCEYEKTLSCPL